MSKKQQAAEIARAIAEEVAANEAATGVAVAGTGKAKTTRTPATWAMGEIRPSGIVIHAIGDHNTIEKASARINKDRGMRAAFVVDVRCLNPELLERTPDIRDEEDEEGEGE